jgi:hypothetical protein
MGMTLAKCTVNVKLNYTLPPSPVRDELNTHGIRSKKKPVTSKM